MILVRNLFELLCVGLETKTHSEISLNHFSDMSLKDWQELKAIADKQSVSAIVLDGLNALIEVYGRNSIATKIELCDWQMFVYDWIGVMSQVEYQNEHQLEVIEEMALQWTVNNCRVMVMKGQANGTLYPRPEHRNPGDIDCYLFKDYAKGNDIAREAGANVDESWYKHSVISYKGEIFENHQYFVHSRDGKRGKLLEKELERQLSDECFDFKELTKSTVKPSVQWTAMFLTYHACAHFISEGLRLKQLLDWVLLLKNHQHDINWPVFYAFCERNHLRRFADAATAISVEHLGVKITNPAITIVSPYAEKVLNDVLYNDDYVFSSGESAWKNRWHLVRNLFHYRWKYEEIYQESVWRQLWFYVVGFLFKTE